MKTKYLKCKYKEDFYRMSTNDMLENSKEELRELERGVPLHKVLGYIEMTGITIDLSKDVLIPRYETEELVLLANEYITSSSSKVLDLCSGSGYIGLAIKRMSGAEVIASDISNASIEQIEINKNKNNLDIKVIKSDLFENIDEKFDVIISNPPYIPKKNTLNDSVLNFEPHLALFGGEDGNDLYRRIINKYRKYLNPNGVILFEISKDNVDFLTEKNFKIINDINGKPRVAYKFK